MKKIIALVLAAVMMVLALASCTDTKTTDDDTKINFPTLTYLYNNGTGHQAIGEYIQSAFKQYGITLNLTNQEWATFLNTRKDGDYSIARNGWIADYSDPICFLDMWTTNSGNNDVQFGKGDHATVSIYSLDLTSYGYETKVENGTWAETYDVLISTIKSCTDNETRYQLMHLAEDMLMDTGCIVPIYFYTDLYMINKNVNGFYSSPLGYKYFMNTTIEGQDYINVCLASEPDTIDPALNSAVDGASLIAHLFSGLAKWSQDEDGNLVIKADCAESLPDPVVNDDGTVTYTYTLREGLKWSDGQELKASDFEYAWKRAASTALGADYGYMFEVVKGYGEDDVDGLAPLAVTSDDAARTITITLSNSVAYWNELLAFPTYFPVRKDVVANEGWATSPETLIGNGPYTLTGWTHNALITMTKNANYIDADSVTMNTINFYLSDDASAMLANFKKGDWQLIDDIPNDEIDALKTEYPDEFVIVGQIGTYYVCWNINENLLPGSTLSANDREKAQAEIRKALALILDRNHIVNDIAKGGQVAASSFVAMGMTNPDGTEFYKTAGNNEGYYGYYDVSTEAYEANCKSALETLKKYYNIAD